MANTALELRWLHNLLCYMGASSITPFLMHCDNKSAMAIASNPVFHNLTKNIEVDCHITRQEYEKGKIILLYLSGAIS